MSENLRRVLYLSYAPDKVYALWRARMPDGCELMTLSSNDDAERLEKLAIADAVIVAPAVLKPEWVPLAPRLRLVQHQGVGWEGETPIAALRERGIRLAINPLGTPEVVSEHALSLIFACLRHIPRADAAMRRGEWLGTAIRPISRNLRGRTVGIVGMGRIGSAVAALLQPFGVRGLYTDPAVQLPEGLELALGFRRVPLDVLLRESDVVTLHLPATPATHHLINDNTLATMKPEAVLVNCARGAVVDEAALARALSNGTIRAAGIDVFEPEPPLPDNPLLKLDNAVLTPHIAAGTLDAMMAKVEGATANLGRFFRDGSLENEIDLTKLP
ncbi:2-hydroxyacid dehydrogenase [Roseomonas marmotae]|uniref:3-phosphoglycerate dehydrogenase n=1 Tax=Roseomonas marmotae TaxID=2768161 RepID=A0ABS3KEJ6_9PROT|nr:2-hydroxyacid dehydrogenase [Roseomonas marmotae]MBO1074781.1 3-phosphoglycerate dehydrogenase [Roseomonas marmotae]QTI80710.1 3-phosphoglycerate dehydrogenase [Roseomonas marmotae]